MEHLFTPRKRVQSKSQWLTKHKGGRWTYDSLASWWCDDGKRHVSRVALDCHDDHSPAGYYLYGDGTPERLYFD